MQSFSPRRRQGIRTRMAIRSLLTFLLLVVASSLTTPVFSTDSKSDENIRFTVEFSASDLQVTSVEEFQRISLPACDFSDQVGAPEVPVRTVHVALPQGAQLRKWSVQNQCWLPFPGQFNLIPVQPPQILSASASEELIFKSYSGIQLDGQAYPKDVAKFVGQGMIDGLPIAEFLIYPIRYWPGDPGKIEICVRVDLQLELDLSAALAGDSVSPGTIAQRQKDLTVNPEKVSARPPSLTRRTGDLPPASAEYLIVTPYQFASTFQPLADWKTQKGVPARVVTIGEIQGFGFPGDIQAQIREFIRCAAEEWGVMWVLLGGDTQYVPERRAYAMDCEKGVGPNSIPCDLYYADLDGNWNADGDGTYGEIGDDVDLYSDIFVGRAPVNNLSEAQTFVRKVLEYEKSPPADYATSMLFFAQLEWPTADSSESTELIDQRYVPERFDPITKLYQTLGNETRATVLQALQQGHHFINHTGHAGYYRLSAGASGEWLLIEDVDNLTNGNRLSIGYSTGCYPGDFPSDCIAEHFLTNPNGGGIAFIGNSRYGWGSPGNPKFGYSDRYNQQFYKSIFVSGKRQLGEVLAHEKAVLAHFGALVAHILRTEKREYMV